MQPSDDENFSTVATEETERPRLRVVQRHGGREEHQPEDHRRDGGVAADPGVGCRDLVTTRTTAKHRARARRGASGGRGDRGSAVDFAASATRVADLAYGISVCAITIAGATGSRTAARIAGYALLTGIGAGLIAYGARQAIERSTVAP